MELYIYMGVQILASLLGFASLFYIMSKEKVKDKDILATALVASIIACLGYLFQLNAESAGEALLAIKFSFLGKCFVVTLMLLFIGRYLGIFTGKRWYQFLFLSDFVILIFVLTCEHHVLFYRKITFEGAMNFERIQPGPVYIYFLLSQMVKLVIFIYFSNVCMKRNRLVSNKFRFCIIFSGLVPLTVLALIVLDFDRAFDISSLSYAISLFCLLAAVIKMGITDTVEEAKMNAIENMTDGMMVVDNEMQLLYANRVAKEIFAEHSKYSQKVQKRLREALVKERHENYHNGEQNYEIRSAVIGDKEQYRGYMILIIDITERVRQEQEILALKSEAENASRAKSQFLRNISHEFRTPMNTINGMTKILHSADLTAAERSYVEQLRQASDKLQGMLSDVLDYSKIDSGEMNLIQVEYLLRELIRRVYQNMFKKAGQKNLEFIVEIEEDIPRAFFGDDLKIQKILESVVGNAIKFTQQGQILLKVSGKMESHDQCRLYFKVQDTGRGIRKEDYEQIFGEFNQGQEERKDGTGLGLSLAQKLAVLMGGDITFTSVFGVGSEFLVSICQKVLDEEPEEQEELFEEKLIPEFTAPKAVVAIVDDSPMNLKVAEQALHYFEMDVHLFQSGQEFIEEIEKGFAPDIILLDQMMPDLDGKETFKVIRTYDQTTPVILMSSNEIEGIREEMIDAGFEDCIFKPMREEKIKQSLYHALPKDKIILEPMEEAEDTVKGEDREYLEEQMERLEKCLEYYDLVRANRIMEELDQQIMHMDVQEDFKEIRELLRRAEFEEALGKVKMIQSKMGRIRC